MSDDRHGEGDFSHNNFTSRVCCNATIVFYTERVYPIEGPTNLRCQCGRLWHYDHAQKKFIERAAP
jgi:hypothetical protein